MLNPCFFYHNYFCKLFLVVIISSLSVAFFTAHESTAGIINIHIQVLQAIYNITTEY